MKELILDGNNFSDINGFFYEVDKILTNGLDWIPGHNFSAYNDLLRGGFGVHNYGEPIVIKWLNYDKSKSELGEEFIYKIIEITLDCDQSGHDCKLELY